MVKVDELEYLSYLRYRKNFLSFRPPCLQVIYMLSQVNLLGESKIEMLHRLKYLRLLSYSDRNWRAISKHHLSEHAVERTLIKWSERLPSILRNVQEYSNDQA
jgi:hypothetical protein